LASANIAVKVANSALALFFLASISLAFSAWSDRDLEAASFSPVA